MGRIVSLSLSLSLFLSLSFSTSLSLPFSSLSFSLYISLSPFLFSLFLFLFLSHSFFCSLFCSLSILSQSLFFSLPPFFSLSLLLSPSLLPISLSVSLSLSLHQSPECRMSALGVTLCVITFVEALIFGLFVTIMMCDQLGAIFDNTPGIDALQDKKGKKIGRYTSLCNVFGEGFTWSWFFPLQLPKKGI